MDLNKKAERKSKFKYQSNRQLTLRLPKGSQILLTDEINFCRCSHYTRRREWNEMRTKWSAFVQKWNAAQHKMHPIGAPSKRQTCSSAFSNRCWQKHCALCVGIEKYFNYFQSYWHLIVSLREVLFVDPEFLMHIRLSSGVRIQIQRCSSFCCTNSD